MADPRNNQGFIQLGGPTFQSPSTVPIRGPQPPVPPHPPQRAQSFPVFSVPVMRQQDMRDQDIMRIREMQGGQQHQAALPPPLHKIPPDFQSAVVISDIRQASEIEADAREALSGYIVFRFEKLNDPENVDDDGYPVKPNWDQATKTQLHMSKQDAASQIRRLNKRWSVWDKRASLKPSQQRHFENTLQQLHQDELDPRYYYELAQIDERKIERHAVEYSRSSKSSKEVGRLVITRRGASISKERSSKGRKKERVSLTGYFKRMPRPEESAKAMNSERVYSNANNVMRLSPQSTSFSPPSHMQRGPPAIFAQHQALPPPQRQQIEPQILRQALPPGQGQGQIQGHLQGQVQPQGQGQPRGHGQPQGQGQLQGQPQGQRPQPNVPPRPPPPPGQGGMQPKVQQKGQSPANVSQVRNPQGQGRNQPIQGMQQKMVNQANINKTNGNKPFPIDQQYARNSRRSMSSSSYTSSSSDSGFTPESSSTSDGSRPVGRGRRRSRSRMQSRSRSRQRPRDRPENYGIDAPRRHSRQEQQYLSDPFLQRVTVVPRPPSPPTLGPSPAELQMIQDDAFRAGIAEGRASSRSLETRAADDMLYTRRAIGAAAARPAIIQRQPNVRVVSPGELRQRMIEEDLDRFDQLRIEDDLRLDDIRRIDAYHDRPRFVDRPRLDERQRFDDRQRFDEEMAVMRELAREDEIRRHHALDHQIRLQQEEENRFAMEAEQVRHDRAVREHMMRRERSPSEVRFSYPGIPNISYGQRHRR